MYGYYVRKSMVSYPELKCACYFRFVRISKTECVIK